MTTTSTEIHRLGTGLNLGPEFEWQKYAACAQRQPTPAKQRQYADRFYPNGRPPVEFKKRLCAQCPVRQACLDHALAWDEDGIWGGTTKPERERMQQERTK